MKKLAFVTFLTFLLSASWVIVSAAKQHYIDTYPLEEIQKKPLRLTSGCEPVRGKLQLFLDCRRRG